MIRAIVKDDLKRLVEIDEQAYGKYGAEAYLSRKLAVSKGLAVETRGKITAFTFFDILEKNQVPEDYVDLKLAKELGGKWAFLAAFTTPTNYADAENDALLLQAAEKAALRDGCIESTVPLPKKHPFEKNDVLGFWTSNGYREAGEIVWLETKTRNRVPCLFFRKKL